jgi:septum site-determining protein MinC
MSRDNAIEFKGTKKGIFIQINQQLDYETIKVQLIQKLENTNSFFSGANILDIQCSSLSEEEKQELKKLMADRYKMVVQLEAAKSNTAEGQEMFLGISEGVAKFFHGTVRSGQRLFYEGNLVIIGDVNPGAEVIAHGNIIVMGSCRGIAHAGSNGNTEACVAAYHLNPTQLRIADTIARSPDGDFEKPIGPEVAKVRESVVYIEPYLMKK